jgi:hypothetical protein
MIRQEIQCLQRCADRKSPLSRMEAVSQCQKSFLRPVCHFERSEKSKIPHIRSG